MAYAPISNWRAAENCAFSEDYDYDK